MADGARDGRIEACGTCHLVQRVPALDRRQRARCSRCGRALTPHSAGDRRNPWAAAIAASALILFPLAVALPVFELESFGARRETSILGGVAALFAEGSLLAAAAVLVCSVVAPPLKLIGILLLVRPPEVLSNRALANLLRAIEWSGRWGMLDVVLVALLVAGLKLGDLVRVTVGPGTFAFTLVVVASLAAAALLDPRPLWERAFAAERRALG